METPIALDTETRWGYPETAPEMARLEKIRFRSVGQKHLTATITAAVPMPCVAGLTFHVVLWDAEGRLLVTASHPYDSTYCISLPIRVEGSFELDFGEHAAYRKARRFSVAVTRGNIPDGRPSQAQYTLALQGGLNWLNLPASEPIGVVRIPATDVPDAPRQSSKTASNGVARGERNVGSQVVFLSAGLNAPDSTLPVELNKRMELPSLVSWNPGATEPQRQLRLSAIEFRVDPKSRFTARLSAVVSAPRRAELAVHVAILDGNRRLLGAARRPCELPAEWRGGPGTVAYDFNLDFGRDEDYRTARWFAITVTEEPPSSPSQTARSEQQ